MAIDLMQDDQMDQATRLRQLVINNTAGTFPASATHVIAVASGKGGVGKTLLSVNLSIALAARGHRVVLFDMDMGLANADIVLGVEASATWSDVIAGRRSIDEIVVKAPGEIAFVPGVSGIARVANLSDFERHRLMAAMAEVESRYDVAVIDCGAGISRNVIGFAGSADTLLVVATPEPTSITDAYATIKAFARESADRSDLRRPAPAIGVVVNQAESRREGQETYERLATVAARFLHLPVNDYGYILRDEHVPAAVRQRQPVLLRYPRSSASMCIMSSAGRISKEIGHQEEKPSLFYRVMNLFL